MFETMKINKQEDERQHLTIKKVVILDRNKKGEMQKKILNIPFSKVDLAVRL